MYPAYPEMSPSPNPETAAVETDFYSGGEGRREKINVSFGGLRGVCSLFLEPHPEKKQDGVGIIRGENVLALFVMDGVSKVIEKDGRRRRAESEQSVNNIGNIALPNLVKWVEEKLRRGDTLDIQQIRERLDTEVKSLSPGDPTTVALVLLMRRPRGIVEIGVLALGDSPCSAEIKTSDGEDSASHRPLNTNKVVSSLRPGVGVVEGGQQVRFSSITELESSIEEISVIVHTDGYVDVKNGEPIPAPKGDDRAAIVCRLVRAETEKKKEELFLPPHPIVNEIIKRWPFSEKRPSDPRSQIYAATKWLLAQLLNREPLPRWLEEGLVEGRVDPSVTPLALFITNLYYLYRFPKGSNKNQEMIEKTARLEKKLRKLAIELGINLPENFSAQEFPEFYLFLDAVLHLSRSPDERDKKLWEAIKNHILTPLLTGKIPNPKLITRNHGLRAIAKFLSQRMPQRGNNSNDPSRKVF